MARDSSRACDWSESQCGVLPRAGSPPPPHPASDRVPPSLRPGGGRHLNGSGCGRWVVDFPGLPLLSDCRPVVGWYLGPLIGPG